MGHLAANYFNRFSKRYFVFKILIGIGRDPCTSGIGLEKIGVKLDKGYVIYYIFSCFKHIYARQKFNKCNVLQFCHVQIKVPNELFMVQIQ